MIVIFLPSLFLSVVVSLSTVTIIHEVASLVNTLSSFYIVKKLSFFTLSVEHLTNFVYNRNIKRMGG